MRYPLARSLMLASAAGVLLMPPRFTPIAGKAQDAAPASAAPFTFRISFGHKDSIPTEWNGALSVENGRVDLINGWRLHEEDTAGLAGWKIRTRHRVVAEGAPDPKQPIIPSGVTVYGSGSQQTRFHVLTRNGRFEFSLAELMREEKLARLNGSAEVSPMLSSARLTVDAREEDFPSIAESADGTVWAAWQSFNGKIDEIRLRRYQGGRWATFTQVPGVEGDIWRPQVAADAKGRPWVVWSEQIAGNWDLYARALRGESWGERIRLTRDPGPDIYQNLISDAAGDLHVVWQGPGEGDFNIYLRTLRGDRWDDPVTITAYPGNDWEPAVASDGKGRIAVVWDSYRNGDYDVFLRHAEHGRWSDEKIVSASPYFEAHASAAIDPAGRIWVAWERGGANWGKDQGYTIRDRRAGSTLGGPREIRIRCYTNGQWKQPAVDVVSALPPEERQFLQWPKLAVDREGSIWMHFRRRMEHRTRGANQARSIWLGYLTRYAGDRWIPARELPDSFGRISSQSMLVAGASGKLWLAWPTDNRRWYGNSHIPVVNQVYAGSIDPSGASAEARLVDPTPEPSHDLARGHTDEKAALAAIRSARIRVGGDTLRVVRGDLHRHTELSWDGGGTGDSSLLDFYRYMIDAAGMDFGAVTDHNSGGDHLYSYWYIQKTTDMFHLPDRYVSLFGYERSAIYPNGHRNVFHARRGVPVVTFFTQPGMTSERPGVGTGALLENDTRLLYEILRRTGGVAISHTSATRMGTDWRDNDPEVEPVVEIFQGARTSYEFPGAPRSADPEKDAAHTRQAGYEAKGFVNLAWKKGYRLGTITSSDHGSTHISYAMVYAKDYTREGVLEGIRKRRTYGATDNIFLDFRIGEHFMGEEFETGQRPKLRIKIGGTADVARIEIRRNDRSLAVLEPGKPQVDLAYEDSSPEPGLSWYFVRVEQADGQLAWTSPIWVRYR